LANITNNEDFTNFLCGNLSLLECSSLLRAREEAPPLLSGRTGSLQEEEGEGMGVALNPMHASSAPASSAPSSSLLPSDAGGGAEGDRLRSQISALEAQVEELQGALSRGGGGGGGGGRRLFGCC
jgi:hypothetical protein